MKALFSCLILCCSIFAAAQEVKKDTIQLYFLGGQSNMAGHGLNAELPDSLASTIENVWIFNGNATGDHDPTGGLGLWAKLTPGNGSGYWTDGTNQVLSSKFGPELSFGKRMATYYSGEKFALIKYAKGGSSIDSLAARTFGSWEFDYQGGDNQFDYFLKTLVRAFQNSDIDGNGVDDVLVPKGIIWMQGESDAVISDEIAQRYFDHLKRLMDLIRAALRDDDLPVVIGKISDSGLDNDGKTWLYGELVQYAQEMYVLKDKHAAIVRATKHYKYSDPYHYDSEGYINLGIKFAEAIKVLNERGKDQ